MLQSLCLTIVLTIASTAGQLPLQQRTWTYSVQSVICTNDTPDVFEMKAEKRFVSRGVYKTSGIMEVKQSLTDAFEIAVDVFYSPEGKQFTRAPFRVLKTSLSDFANTYYVPIFMKSFQNCTENVPQLPSPFRPPLPVCRVTMAQCRVNTDNFPSYLRSGYYRMVLYYSGQANGTILVEALVEQISNL